MALSTGNGSSQGIRAGSAYVALTSDTSQYDNAMDRAQRRLRQFQQSASRIGAGQALTALANRLNSFGLALSAVGDRMIIQASTVLGALMLAVRQFLREGDRLDKMAARTGADPSWLSAMDYAAQRSGASLEEVEKALRQISKTAVTSNGRSALGALGIDAARFLRYRPETRLEAILSRLALVGNAATRARLAMELFGRSGTSLIPMAGHVDELVREAEKLGIVWSHEEVSDAAKVADAWTTLVFVFRRAVTIIGGSLTPIIRDFTRWMYNNAKAVADFLKRNGALVRLVARWAMAWLTLGLAVKGVALIFRGLAAPVLAFNAMAGSVKALIGMFTALKTAMVAVSAVLLKVYLAIPRVLGPIIARFAVAVGSLYGHLVRELLVLSVSLTRGISMAMARVFVSTFAGISTSFVSMFAVPLVQAAAFVGALMLMATILTRIKNSVAELAKSAWNTMAAGWARVGETVKNAFAVGLRLLAYGEYQRGFGIIAKSAKLAFLGVFRDFIAGWYGLVAEVKEDWWVLCYTMYEGWTWLVAQFKHMGNWFVGDMKKIGVTIGYVFTTALKASWASWKNFFAGVARLAKQFIAKMGSFFTELTENIAYGFKVAYYWSKRLLPGYDGDDYERDVAAAAAARDRAIAEARAKAIAAMNDADQEYAPGPSFAETWKEGMDALEQRLKEIDLEIDLNDENIDIERNNKLIEYAKEIWAKIQKIRELEMQNIAGLDARIEELKAEIAADTAALDEYLQSLDQSAATGYLPDIADDVSRIAANTEPTAAFNADAIAARWRGALGVVATPFRRFAAQLEQISGRSFDYSSGTSDRDRMERLKNSIDNAAENIRRLETAKADGIGTGRIENELAEVIRGLAANGRDFRQYANAMRQNLTFA